MTGPLAGIRVVELGGIGPGPHAAMIFADLGAEVVRIERPDAALRVGDDDNHDHMLRGRRSVALDLKTPEGLAAVRGLIERADVLVEGFRPGVAEKIGIGPDTFAANPGLVYGRMTGWGQTGPLAPRAGHDINYIALTGALHSFGVAGGKPVPPLNLVGDFGGGSMLLVVGVLAALFERSASGRGQVVDAAMVDGTSLLMQLIWSLRGVGMWRDLRGSNIIDTGAPFYDTYQCADGGWVAVGALEPQFYASLVGTLGLVDLPPQNDPRGWPTIRAAFEEAFRGKSRDEWAGIFEQTDACVTPVLSLAEAGANEHLVARETLVEVDGVTQAAPAPRFSRSSLGIPSAPGRLGADTEAVLADWGIPSAHTESINQETSS